ncbi:alpha/beta fold hydrolase [Flavobacteriaceae bacterium R33]|uniref:Alpha/beta fold hydrolase n=2 Tax=Poritiphilus flavus TaxID=2697053 RepID=A0A6L9EGE8_9FLAO|nr:alpha/beta fold hydrolase [Poritiphilus flavus]
MEAKHTLQKNTESTIDHSLKNTDTNVQKVHFQSDGLTLVGHLYTPDNFDQSKKYPAVITGGSLTSVKEQMAGTYARKLAEQGFVALAFDYRNYGESEGQPRQYEDPQLKLKDLQAATTYLLALPFVDHVGALGVCTSGGNVAYLAAEDDRIKAVATVAAWLPDENTLPLLYGSQENLDELRRKGQEAKKKFASTGETDIILAYHNEDQSASHVGPMEYYMDNNRGGGVAEWKNELAVMSWEAWLDFDPMSKAKNITIPFMMVHSDGSALPDNAKSFYNDLQGEKELVWSDGYHFDYYDQPAQVNAAVEKVSTFFADKLK